MNKAKRPFLVTCLAFSVLSLTVWNAIRFVSAMAQRSVLDEFASPPGALYVALTGLFWTASGAALTLGLYSGQGWAKQAAGPAGIAYVVYYWLDYLYVQQNSLSAPWLCPSILTLLWLTLLFSALLIPASRDFFQAQKERKDERQPEDSTTA